MLDCGVFQVVCPGLQLRSIVSRLLGCPGVSPLRGNSFVPAWNHCGTPKNPITSRCCRLEVAQSVSACTLHLRPVQSPSAAVQGVPCPCLYPGLMGFLGSSSMGPKSSGPSPTTSRCSYLLSCPSCRPLPWEFCRPLAATSHVGMVRAGNTTPCASQAGGFALSMPGPL